jgi:large subunit ribosomal protein L24
MANSMSVKAGDRVKVIAGKDKGKEGKVLRVHPETRRVIVERVNMMKKHQRPTNKRPQGGIIELEAPIHVSNVMLVCPSCSQPTRTGRVREDGARIRTCKKCGNRIDK